MTEKEHPSKEGPIEAQYRVEMTALAHFLADELQPAGFALFVFDMNAPGRMNYISNARREDMLVAMKEFIARNEGYMPEEPDTPQ